MLPLDSVCPCAVRWLPGLITHWGLRVEIEGCIIVISRHIALLG